jgi:hypothetical protein
MPTSHEASLERLWSLPFGRLQIDPSEIAAALNCLQIRDTGTLDTRSRLLIRDALRALLSHWGEERFRAWLAGAASPGALLAIEHGEDELRGFTTLKERLMDATQPDRIVKFFRDLGASIHGSSVIYVGGSIALILSGVLSRHTDDVDAVDEIPAPIRAEKTLLDELSQLHGLRLTHFQSHYLPDGWQERTRSFGQFGQLQVHLVDPIDIFVGKLFSRRVKDRDDLRTLSERFERAVITDRLRRTAARSLADEAMRQAAEKNWYVIYGDALPLTA